MAVRLLSPDVWATTRTPTHGWQRLNPYCRPHRNAVTAALVYTESDLLAVAADPNVFPTHDHES